MAVSARLRGFSIGPVVFLSSSLKAPTMPPMKSIPEADQQEVFKVIPTFPDYEISNQGFVRRLADKTVVPSYIHKSGYEYIFLEIPSADGNRKRCAPEQVHRLLLLAHRGPCPEGCETLHLNDQPLDNFLSNLVWAHKKSNAFARRRADRRAAARKLKLEAKGVASRDVAETYESGATLTATAKTHGISQALVKHVLMLEGVKIRGGRAKLDGGQVVYLHEIGATLPQIAEIEERHVRSVRRTLRENGVKFDRKTIDRFEVARLYEQGMRPYEIALAMGITSDSACRVLEELAASGRVTYEKREARPKADEGLIRALAAEGKTNAEIVEITGYSASTVWKANGNLKSGHVVERNALILVAFREGRTSDSIAEEYGVSSGYAVQLARAAGMKVHRGAIRHGYVTGYLPKHPPKAA